MPQALPEWFDPLLEERLDVATRHLISCKTADETFEAKGRIAALTDLKDAIGYRIAEISAEERQSAERFLGSNVGN